ncbi:DUF4115 domain-containing protein [Gracilibacillus caseinilyticus]|uniref:DUF4115 domain-containing protein n=1 Tax=Gracilibacillus caseinilyticus TaxID=2932256 RepID=A0ABY4ETR5_9BACI|nr:RodZ domain-containing protein [Gracilibacillus caseinilyticus]UOQ47811.1 DUF4115 domain-containing protein [Gracilibacillus caseinilyticus]
MGIGERLKEERERQNMTLQDVQTMTKIQVRYLDAIEQERFNVMPGSFYVRAFIKEYATILGINPDELMEEYKKDLPFDQEEQVSLSRVNSSKKNSTSVKTPTIFSFLPSVIVVLLIIGIVAMIWLFRQGIFGEEDDNNSTPADNNDNSAGEEVELPPTQEGNEESNGESEEQSNSEEGTNQENDQVDETEVDEPTTGIVLDSYENDESNYTITTSEEQLTLEITTNNKNWLEIEDQSGESYYNKTLTKDAGPVEVDITNIEELYLRFGAPEDINININGQSVPLSEDIQAGVQEAWFTIEKQ